MQGNNEKRSQEAQRELQQPGEMSSFNQKDVERSTDVEGAKKAGIDKKGDDTDNKSKAGESADLTGE
jgi:hypothetical protein